MPLLHPKQKFIDQHPLDIATSGVFVGMAIALWIWIASSSISRPDQTAWIQTATASKAASRRGFGDVAAVTRDVSLD